LYCFWRAGNGVDDWSRHPHVGKREREVAIWDWMHIAA
jgi:hypothetical protein